MRNRFANLLRSSRSRITDQWQDASDDVLDDRSWVKYVLAALVALFIVLVF